MSADRRDNYSMNWRNGAASGCRNKVNGPQLLRKVRPGRLRLMKERLRGDDYSTSRLFNWIKLS
jgi:hypothetical protein